MTPPKTILIGSGPTREFIDPVRFISNPSTGKMGYELAREANRRHFKVILISGPGGLNPPGKVKFIPVTTARQMRKMIKKFFPQADCLIMPAAVSDYRPERPKSEKIKTKGTLSLKLVRNPDILAEVSKYKGKKTLIGFSLETRDLIKNTRLKLIQKKLDLIVANKVEPRNLPFGNNKVSYLMVDRFGNQKTLRNISKERLAKAVFGWLDFCKRV